jgi:hypothetical protein
MNKTVLGVILAITLVTTFGAMTPIFQHEAEGGFVMSNRAAPPAITAENVYVAWWTNNTANNNEEILFRASTDGGATFGDKINLSNTTDADSTRAEIDSDADSVVVTWWPVDNFLP